MADEHLVVGVARFVLRLPGCRSLKDKRRVVRSVRDRLAANHNVSVAEVGAQDEHARAVLAMGLVGSDSKGVRAALQTLLDKVETMSLAPVVERRVEITTYGDSLSEPHLGDFDRW